MRKIAIAIVVLCLACLSASLAAGGPNFPWDCPSPKGNIANGTITTGFILDCVGFGCTLGTSAAFLVSPGFGQILLGVADLGYLAGGLVMDLGVEKRHSTLAKAGYKIKTGNRSLSRTLLIGTVALSGIGLGLGIAGSSSSEEGGGVTGLAIGSLVSCGLASIVEIINVAMPRTEWIKDINQAVSGKRQKKAFEEEAVGFTPLFSVIRARSSVSLGQEFFVGGAISY